MRCAAFVVCWLGLSLPLVYGADWPEWGGPEQNGISPETGLIDEWPTSGVPLLWQRELGQGYSSFAIVGDRAFTQYQDLWGQYLVCLDMATGKTLWSEKYDAPYETVGIYPGPRSTPCVHQGRVYCVSPDAVLLCVNAETGRRVWTVDLDERYHGDGTEFGYSASPRVVDGQLILPVGGRKAALVALDPATGKERWTAGDAPASYCSVQPMTLGQTRAVLAYLQNSLLLCRVSDGAVLWSSELSSGYDEHAAMPLIQGDQFVVSAPFKGGASASRLTLDTTTDPPRAHRKNLWHAAQFSNDTASSVVWQDAIYGFDLRDPQAKAHRPSRGEFRCLDWKTGKVLWSDTTVGHATAIAVDDKLILFNDRGELILARASTEAYQEIGRVEVFRDEICWTAPALSQGRVLLRTQSRVACLDLQRASRRPGAVAITPGMPAVPAPAAWHPGWLLGGEREHPFMRPAADELVGWYTWSCLASVLPSLLLGWLIHRCWPRRPTVSVAVCVGLMFVTGVVASPVGNRWTEDFVFTWPAALFANLLALLFLRRVWLGQTLTWKGQILARLVLLVFAIVCGAYFWILRDQSLPHEWAFLLGYAPALWPTDWLARRWKERGMTALNAVWTWFIFSLFFWSCGAWHALRSALAS